MNTNALFLFACLIQRLISSNAFSLDFETGELTGWTKTGTAFDYQPTYGDNPTARNRGQPSQHEGVYWIGGYERYEGPNTGFSPGSVQGDAPQGTLTSDLFYNTADYLRFLIGGGNDINYVYVELILQNGTSVKRATGLNTESMEYVVWDIHDFKHQQLQIRIVDTDSGGWGHINCDDFQFIDVDNFDGSIYHFTNDFETGDLRGWRESGDAFNYQPTYGDNPTARNRGQPSHHQGNYWIGGYEKYTGPGSGYSPGDIQGDLPQGTLSSSLFVVSHSALKFLIGGGNDMNRCYVELVLLDGQIVRRETGRNTETMEYVYWNIDHLRGEIAQIRIVDYDSGGWGHINCDDFTFY